MPATMMHLYAAKLLWQNATDEFFLGNIFPDAIDNDRPFKDKMHFRDLPEEKRLPALTRFAREKLRLERDADFGVLFHLYLDQMWDEGPQKRHREAYRGENWFRDYRREISEAGSYLARTEKWAFPLWARLLHPEKEMIRNDIGLKDADIYKFLEYNVHWHTTEKIGPSRAFPPKEVEKFTRASILRFCRYMETEFPGVREEIVKRGVQMNDPKILVVMGGTSTEREVSLRSGKAVLDALKEAGFRAEGFDLKKGNLHEIPEKKPDLVFLALHGKGGEDGSIQGALEWMGIPYTGPDVLSSAVCMNKIFTKRVLRDSGIPTPDFLVLADSAQSDPQKAAENAAEILGYPVVFKACCQGSSIGTVIVRKPEGAGEALSSLFPFGDDILAESFCPGMELTVPILGNEDLRALPVIEITSVNEFYDYDSKYTPGKCSHIIPARIPETVREKVQKTALEAYRACGCRGFSRVDVMLSEKGEPKVVEINTIPGMTAQSLFPDAARAAGISFAELVTQIVRLALER